MNVWAVLMDGSEISWEDVEEVRNATNVFELYAVGGVIAVPMVNVAYLQTEEDDEEDT